MTTQPENDTQEPGSEAVAQQQACSPVWRVEWQAANLHPCDGIGATVRAWQLRINGRIVLNAVAMSDIHEAVTAEDRKMIGQALAESLANNPEQKRGGPRHAPASQKLAKLKRLKAMLADGYGMEIACKRAGTTSITARNWAKELNFKI